MEGYPTSARRSWLKTGVIGVLIVLIVLLIVVPLTIVRTVSVGNAVVLVDPLGGTVSDPITGPAWFFKAPWVSDVHIYYAQDSVGMWREGELQGDFPPITPISRDGLRIEVDILVRWSLDPMKLKDLYQRFPNLDWKDRVISSVVRETGRDVIGQYTAIQTIENRSTITTVLADAIRTSLVAEESLLGSLVNIELDLRDINPPEEFLTAIEAKLAAEQAQLQAEFERNTILILANATARQQIIEAEGQATSLLIVANATAESIEILAQDMGVNATELTNLYLTLEALRDISKTAENFIVILGQDGLTYMVPTG